MKITKPIFKKKYYKLKSQEVANFFGITRLKVYHYVKLFKLKKKSELPKPKKYNLDLVPGSIEEYHKKWSNQKNSHRWVQKAYNDMKKTEHVRSKVLDLPKYELFTTTKKSNHE